MNPSILAQWTAAQSLFEAVADLPTSQQRSLLEQLCEGDQALVTAVIHLLEEDARPQQLLDQGLSSLAAKAIAGSDVTELQQRQIGPYRLLRLLGEGGMGVVYLAERIDIGGYVALKLLRDAWMSPARRRRFQREQILLAKLKYPGIAQIYDVGVWQDTPWFAMEYAEGLPLTEGLQRRAGGYRHDLLIFREVCEAVQYAHSVAIVHRDLKPSNIVLTSTGKIKLLDFGIARYLEPEADEARTVEGLRMMTPLYAAPEQRKGGNIGVFTDIYTLGVLLYEILTRRLPLTPDGPSQLPLPPSVAARANTRSADAYAGSLQWADLDTLCLTALQVEPERRYRSVDALMRDIDALLEGRPLAARPPSWPHYARKFIHRNRGKLVTAAAIVALFVAGFTVFTIRLTQARNAALAELARTQRIQSFTERLFDAGEPEAGPALDVSTQALLARGEAEAESLRGDPLMQADLLSTIGGAYQKLGQLAHADLLLQQALTQRQSRLADNDARNVESLTAMGLLRKDQGRMDEAEHLLRRAVQLGAGQANAATASPGHALWALGLVLGLRGKYQESEGALLQALTLDSRSGQPNAQLGEDFAQLADAHFYLGDYREAETLNQKALTTDRAIFGDGHPSVAGVLNSLGHIAQNEGQVPEAEAYFSRALAIDQRWYGAEHPAVASDLASLAKVKTSRGAFEQAEDLLHKALTIDERTYGHDHPRVALLFNDLGTAAYMRDHYDDAEHDFREAAAIWLKTYGEHHVFVGLAYANLVGVFMHRKQYPVAEQMARKALDIYKSTLPADHVNLAVIHVKLGRILIREGRYAEAEPETAAGYHYFAAHESDQQSYYNGARGDLLEIQTHLHKPEIAQWMAAEKTTR